MKVQMVLTEDERAFLVAIEDPEKRKIAAELLGVTLQEDAAEVSA